MNPIKVEVGQYREVNKGTLKAFFSLVIYPQGQKILDCRYFVQNDKRWFSFPQKEIKYTDGRKSEFIPYVSYLDKDYLEKLKIAVLEQIKTVTTSETNGKTKHTTNQVPPHKVQAESSFDPGELPF
jgi:hypothetical protein